MAKAIIRADDHSLYLRTNGMVYRPVHSRNTTGNRPLSGTVTRGLADQMVTIGAIAGSPLARVVVTPGSFEIWFSHGTYLKMPRGFIDSNDVWNPALPIKAR